MVRTFIIFGLISALFNGVLSTAIPGLEDLQPEQWAQIYGVVCQTSCLRTGGSCFNTANGKREISALAANPESCNAAGSTYEWGASYPTPNAMQTAILAENAKLQGETALPHVLIISPGSFQGANGKIQQWGNTIGTEVGKFRDCFQLGAVFGQLTAAQATAARGIVEGEAPVFLAVLPLPSTLKVSTRFEETAPESASSFGMNIQVVPGSGSVDEVLGLIETDLKTVATDAIVEPDVSSDLIVVSQIQQQSFGAASQAVANDPTVFFIEPLYQFESSSSSPAVPIAIASTVLLGVGAVGVVLHRKKKRRVEQLRKQYQQRSREMRQGNSGQRQQPTPKQSQHQGATQNNGSGRRGEPMNRNANRPPQNNGQRRKKHGGGKHRNKETRKDLISVQTEGGSKRKVSI